MTTEEGGFRPPPYNSIGVWSPEYAVIKDGQLWWHPYLNPDDPPDYVVVGEPLDFRKILDYHEKHGPKSVDPKGLLDRFLHIKTPEDILMFTKDYGPLQLCRGGEPINPGHRPGSLDLTCMPSGWPGSWWSEGTDHWLRYVSAATGILAAAALLHLEEDVPEVHWDAMNWILSVPYNQPHNRLPEGVSINAASLANPNYENVARGDIEAHREEHIETERRFLSMALDSWLRMVEFGMSFSWSGADPQVSFLSGTSATLVLQIIFAVTGSRGTAFCSGCGLIYFRGRRKAQTGRRNFCPKCKEEGVDAKVRKRAQRAKT